MKKKGEQGKEKSIKKDDFLEDFDFYIMPQDYQGKALIQKSIPKPVAPKVKKPDPIPEPTIPNPIPQKKKKRVNNWLVIGGVLFLVVLSIISYLFVRPTEDTLPIEVSEPFIPAREEESPVEPESIDVPIVPVQGIDTDSDGLTDTEEALYGSESRNPDTDADSFLDGNEVFHLFDPLSPDPSLLIDSVAIELMNIEEPVQYSLLRPKSWLVISDETSEIDDAVSVADLTLQPMDGSKIKISFYEKDEGVGLETWYLSQREVDSGPKSRFLDMISKQGLIGMSSVDQRITFLDIGSYAVFFHYDLVGQSRVEYLQTFQMMVNSFKTP